MPTPTYFALAKNVLTSNQTSITISSIPQTYTDLMLVMSVKLTNNSDVAIRINSNTANYSYTRIYSQSQQATLSDNSTGNSRAVAFVLSEFAGTADTFGSSEVYIPNYTGSDYKLLSSTGVFESNNDTNYAARVHTVANLWQGTAAVTSLYIFCPGVSFVSGSRFDLYGIKNS